MEHGKVSLHLLCAAVCCVGRTLGCHYLTVRNMQVVIEKDGRNVATIDAGEIVGLQALQVL